MDQNKKELEQLLAGAGSPEELGRILNDAGEKIGPEDAAKLFGKLQNRGTAQELSPDELDAVSGGSRNALTEGCAATVEAGSHCFFTDFCPGIFTTYDVCTAYGSCMECGAAPVYFDCVNGRYFCPKCGCKWDGKGNPIREASQGAFPEFKF